MNQIKRIKNQQKEIQMVKDFLLSFLFKLKNLDYNFNVK
jgi:hypothetical protein